MSNMRAVFIALVVACAGAVSAVHVPRSHFTNEAPDGSTFRPDYNFHEEADGWIKLHRVSSSWHNARLTCYLEGARLASPLNKGLYSTMKWMQQATGIESIYTGVHAMSYGTDYFSVEGVQMVEMPLEWAMGQPDNRDDKERCLAMVNFGLIADVECSSAHAFFCYRQKIGEMRMNECGNNDDKYQKNEQTGSCYKFHPNPTTWYQAHSVCANEGGRLAIINSEEEAKILRQLAGPQYTFIGIFNWFRDDQLDLNQWKTLDDKTLEDAGYAGWLPGEPNNAHNGEYCGTLFAKKRWLGLNDFPCQWTAPFICEIEKPRVPKAW